MKNSKFLIAIILFFGSLSCDKDDSPYYTEFVKGEYEGIFYRTHPNMFYTPAVVALTFRDSTFEGTKSNREFPSICHGLYELVEDEIIFQDHCSWTADFDWRYILNGTFTVQIHDDKLYLIRDYGDDSYDTYELTLVQ